MPEHDPSRPDLPAAPGTRTGAEIGEQPLLWRAQARDADGVEAAVELLRSRDVRDVVLAGRGTSGHAARYGQYLFPVEAGVRAHVASPGIATLYDRALHGPGTAVVVLSQSGQSPDLLATASSARRRGAVVVAVTADPASPLARLAHVHVPLGSGAERSVVSTKGYTAELLALYLLAHRWAGVTAAELEFRVGVLAEAAEEVLDRNADASSALATQMTAAERALVVGRGYGLPTALETALKLMETCGISASGWSSADVRHGPLGQVRPGTPVLCLRGAADGRGTVDALVPELLVRGALVSHTLREGDVAPDTGRFGGAELWLPTFVEEPLVPLLEILPLQQLALELALRRGADPDRPAGRSKITLTA